MSTLIVESKKIHYREVIDLNSRTKLGTLGLSVLTLSALVAGCGTAANTATNTTSNGTSGTQNASGTVDLSKASGTVVWAASPIAQTGIRKTLISEFEKTHPNIKVQLVELPNNTDTNRQSLATEIGGGATTPDVYMGDVIWPAQFGQNQLAVPLNKYLPSSFFNRFASGLVQGASYKGNVYGAPLFVDSGFLYYRKDLLQKAGLQPPQSWEQLMSDAQTLQKKGLVKYGFVWQGAPYEGLTCDFMEYLTDAGGQVLNSQGQPTIDSPQAQKAVSFMKSLITSGVSPKAEVTFQEAQSMNVFDQGNAAFLRNWDYAWSNSQNPADSKVVGKVGVEPLPTFGGPNGHATIGGWDLYVNPHTKNLNASLEFINWMTGVQAQTILATKYSEIPTNAAVQNDPQVKKVNPVLNIVSQVKLVSRPSQTPSYPQVSQAIYTNVNQALSGGTSVSAALKKAQQQIQSAVSGNGGL